MKIEEAVFENRSINDVTFMRLVGVDSKREKRSGVLLNSLAWTSGYVDAVDDQVWEKNVKQHLWVLQSYMSLYRVMHNLWCAS